MPVTENQLVEFKLRSHCNGLVQELTELIGNNTLKLSFDVQLPEVYNEVPEHLMKSLKDIILFTSDYFTNGAILIKFIKRNNRENLIYTQIVISTSGTKRKNFMDKTEVGTYFRHLPFTLHYKYSENQISINLSANLHATKTISIKDNLAFKTKRILIAEDNEINAMIFSSFLEEWGCEVTITENGAEAIAKMQEGIYDAILMDLYMPVINGNIATAKIREFNSTIPIIMLTASTVEQDIRDAMNVGANDYLLKPVNSTNLYELLTKYL